MDMSFSELWELVTDWEAWHAVIHEVTKSRTQLSDWIELTLMVFWCFTYLAVWPWSSPLTSVFSSGKWASSWYFNLLDCICAWKEQVSLRGLSGFLSLEQKWIILPPGEKEIFSLEVCVPFQRLNTDSSQMTSISEPWYRTLTETMLLFSGVPQELMITVSDHSLP